MQQDTHTRKTLLNTDVYKRMYSTDTVRHPHSPRGDGYHVTVLISVTNVRQIAYPTVMFSLHGKQRTNTGKSHHTHTYKYPINSSKYIMFECFCS